LLTRIKPARRAEPTWAPRSPRCNRPRRRPRVRAR